MYFRKSINKQIKIYKIHSERENKILKKSQWRWLNRICYYVACVLKQISSLESPFRIAQFIWLLFLKYGSLSYTKLCTKWPIKNRNMYKGPMDKAKGVGLRVEGGGEWGRGDW